MLFDRICLYLSLFVCLFVCLLFCIKEICGSLYRMKCTKNVAKIRARKLRCSLCVPCTIAKKRKEREMHDGSKDKIHSIDMNDCDTSGWKTISCLHTFMSYRNVKCGKHGCRAHCKQLAAKIFYNFTQFSCKLVSLLVNRKWFSNAFRFFSFGHHLVSLSLCPLIKSKTLHSFACKHQQLIGKL